MLSKVCGLFSKAVVIPKFVGEKGGGARVKMRREGEGKSSQRDFRCCVFLMCSMLVSFGLSWARTVQKCEIADDRRVLKDGLKTSLYWSWSGNKNIPARPKGWFIDPPEDVCSTNNHPLSGAGLRR